MDSRVFFFDDLFDSQVAEFWVEVSRCRGVQNRREIKIFKQDEMIEMNSRWVATQIKYLFFTPTSLGKMNAPIFDETYFSKGLKLQPPTPDFFVKILQIHLEGRFWRFSRGLKASLYGRKSHDIHRRCTSGVSMRKDWDVSQI